MENGGHEIAVLAGLPRGGVEGAHGHTADAIGTGGHGHGPSMVVIIAVIDVVVQFGVHQMTGHLHVFLVDGVRAVAYGSRSGRDDGRDDGSVVLAVDHRLQQQVERGTAQIGAVAFVARRTGAARGHR